MKIKIKYVIVLLLLSASGYFIYANASEIGLAKPALILQVSTNFTEDGMPMINNLTIEQSTVPFFYKRADSIPEFPEIQVYARINAIAAPPASYWASVHFEDEGTYTLKILFRDGFEPKKGDVMILPVRVIGYTGKTYYKTTAFHVWE